MAIKEENKQVELKEEVRARAKRKPYGVPVSKLSVANNIEGHYMRWINDVPGQIARAQESGFEFVTPEEVGRESRDENRVVELVGTHKDGSPMLGYLMKIKQEWHEEDRQVITDHLDKIDEAIRGGKVNASPADNRYVPPGGISYKNK